MHPDPTLAQGNGQFIDATGKSQGVEVSSLVIRDDAAGGAFVQSWSLTHGFAYFPAIPVECPCT
jgi:hypothetical protein